MTEYDVAFGRMLAETAGVVVPSGHTAHYVKRTVLYLSLLSIEISLKALLEKAGWPISNIKDRSHNLADLLKDLGQCFVPISSPLGTKYEKSAACIRGCTIRHGAAEITVGKILEAEGKGASKYPNQVRYGSLLKHYPPSVVADAAKAVADFAQENWNSIHK